MYQYKNVAGQTAVWLDFRGVEVPRPLLPRPAVAGTTSHRPVVPHQLDWDGRPPVPVLGRAPSSIRLAGGSLPVPLLRDDLWIPGIKWTGHVPSGWSSPGSPAIDCGARQSQS